MARTATAKKEQAEAEKEPKTTIRAIRVELAKPLNRSWEEFGSILHTQRALMGQLLQAAVDTAVACQVVGPETVKGVIAPRARAEKASGLAYQGILRELEKIREGKWDEKQRPALGMASGILANASKRAFGDLMTYRSAQYGKRRAGHGKRGRASYGSRQPIQVPRVDWELVQDGKLFELHVKLLSKGTERIGLRMSHGWHYSMLEDIAQGHTKRGDCKLVYDERKKKWYGLLAYHAEEVPPKTVDPKRVLIVHRGVSNALTLLPSTGERALYIAGQKFLGQRKKFQARMRDMRRVSGCERGEGAQGRGSKRRYQSYEALEGKLARVVATTCQQWAAQVAETAEKLGCGLVVIEDYGGLEPAENDYLRRCLERFPLFRLKLAIEQALRKRGIRLEEVPAEYVSSKCPRCESADTRYHNTRTNVFHCKACGFERPADFVAGLNMLFRSSADATVWKKKLEQERVLAEKMRTTA